MARLPPKDCSRNARQTPQARYPPLNPFPPVSLQALPRMSFRAQNPCRATLRPRHGTPPKGKEHRKKAVFTKRRDFSFWWFHFQRSMQLRPVKNTGYAVT